MKEYLENLEIGEGKVKLSKEEIKSILVENGKVINNEVDKTKEELKTEIDGYKEQINTLEESVKTLPDSKELEELKTELQKMKEIEEERTKLAEKEEEDKALTSKIVEVIGEKEFVNDYTKKSVVNEIKSAINDEANKGKSYKDIFEELTKDKEGIFANPHQPNDMNDMNQNISTNVTKEAFDKMGYQDRLNLKQENPDLYQSFIK